MAIIDDILDYTKIESGKLQLEHRPMDLVREAKRIRYFKVLTSLFCNIQTYVVESALKLVSPNFMDKDMVLWYNIDPDVHVSVYGDVVRLRQVLLNL